MTRILLTGARAPVALHLARLLWADGCEVLLADTLCAPLARHSRACSRYFRLPEPATDPDAFAAALAGIIETERPSHVVPTCEEVFYLAWAFASRRLDARLLAPDFATLARAHDKAVFAADARAFGLAPPQTLRIADKTGLDQVRDKAGELVMKPVWSRFACRTLIAPDPAALAHIVPTPAEPWVAQELIAGEELCAYAIAHAGRVATLSIYRPTHRAGLGAGVCFEPTRDESVAADVAAYVAATRWTGQISFDFRRDAAGRPRVLECNPRATSGVHFYGPGSGLSATLLAGEPARPDVTRPLMIPGAMLTYGLREALRSRRLARWMRDMRTARDALAWPGDRLPAMAQPRAIAELVRIARRTGTSLTEASTAGIAWNGAPIGRSHIDTHAAA